MEQYKNFVGVTTSVLEYIAGAEISNGKGGYLKLRDDEGKVRLKVCMSLLGFSNSHQPELVLREEKEIKDRVDTVLIRDQQFPSMVKYATVYNGKLREDYEPPEEMYPYLRNIMCDGDIMDLKTDCLRIPIEEVAPDYN